MGKKFLFGVAALGADHDFQPRPGVDFRFNARHQIKVDVRNEQQRLKGFHLEAILMVFLPYLGQGNAGPEADLGQGGRDVVAVLARQGKAVGSAIVGQHLVPVVQNATARGEDALQAQAVFLGLAGKLLAPVNLEIPETNHKDEEKQTHQHLQKDDAATRGLIALAVHLDFQPGAVALFFVRLRVRRFRRGKALTSLHHTWSSAAWR